ncbi:MAG: sigma-70 family RNA polymerase sigma factor [Ginsengibacter sp.]
MKDYHQLLFPYAYNILGSVDDAEDAVQEAMVKFISVQKDDVRNEKAYLIRMVINQSIKMKDRMKRMINRQTWLPEPILTEGIDENINDEQLLSYTMLVLLEQLNARERAIFILKEAFSFSHNEIAKLFSLAPGNSRKILSRARQKLHPSKSFSDKSEISSSSFFEQYLDVIRRGDLEALKLLLSHEVSLMADGGEKIQVEKEVILGINATAAMILFIFKKYQQHLKINYHQVNHQPALLYSNDNKVVVCQIFRLETGTMQVDRIYSVVDPDKLNHFYKKMNREKRNN